MVRYSKIAVLILLIALGACQSFKVYTDYDERMDFKEFSRFNFYPDMETGLDSLDHKRFSEALKNQLETQDMHFSSDPEFEVNFYAETHREENRHRIGISIGTYGNHVGGNIGSGIPIGSRKDVLSVTVEFIDAQTHNLFWQTVVEARLKQKMTPEQRRDFFYKIAQKALADYPPKK